MKTLNVKEPLVLATEPFLELVLDETPEEASAPVQDGMEEESFHDDVSEIVKVPSDDTVSYSTPWGTYTQSVPNPN
jgi:hypothetical protein